ncbi:MAG: transglutaminase-like domain-containing protein [Nitrosopumilus sp.]|nr:transglutaminase-like domain-containing protein [Nitrosopumilus sp.]CAI9831834.1 hypothetical protein IBTHAUMO2_450040 [Nitrosopumilaceae archaeon]MDA7941663.1 transglutaminase-like domain-containing protein [Nitrosopumilus sp.]MDA7943762.1 transglutaminase-like domain-containing protein [Nitrosopumilus sp.]MDA7945126.1 transglutaminase-like domain-containing protein [Nitrosopumilus sp.]
MRHDAAEWGAYEGAGAGLAARCLKISQLVESPGLDVARYAGMAARARGVELADGAAPAHLLLDRVIDSRAGAPVALAVLHVEAARARGDAASVAWTGSGPAAMGGGGVIWGPRGAARPVEDGMAAHMLLRQLRGAYRRSGSHGRAGACARMALASRFCGITDVREAGLAGYALGEEGALGHLEEYVAECPDAADAEEVLGIIGEIRGRA